MAWDAGAGGGGGGVLDRRLVLDFMHGRSRMTLEGGGEVGSRQEE